MVGVPGKYKGCNTCRARRVKCDNTRPFCKKCTDYGRACSGYERETVFIVGTQDDKGRVGSHPPRNVQQSRISQSTASAQHAASLSFVAAEPFQPAWHETIAIQSGADSHLIRIVAQHADLVSAIKQGSSPPQNYDVMLSLLDTQPLDVTPTFREENFYLKSMCFVSLGEAGDGSTASSGEGVCLFLYQQNSSTMYANELPRNASSELADEVRELGPAAYQAFPAHHFFARVYRPSAVWAALLNRQPTFLCNPEWTVVPWEHYPRTCLDDLLDVAVLLPSIYSRADHTMLSEANSNRRLIARELLDNCVNIQTQFDIWADVVRQKTRLPYWVGDGSSYVPFNEPLSFASPLLCLAHVYYWAVLIGFHQCVYALLQVTNKPENEVASPGITGDMPPALDPRLYQPTETRKLAALACRSLDFALRTISQPDLLIAPTWIIKDFFSRMNVVGLCELESLWINEFNDRLETRCREMNAWLEDKRWTMIRRFD
ncbi:hypothetical protein F5B22DRAFT_154906 [Xylaria bambusicola]|uniref:uncharacterized protein n=1 Tax=Xylaria bambusicola TaxID=326684 RepID=UPI00200759C9|nr:uncharacterized protein F5B22DRAFT_154906 [Xylaria bambusicola]KAI0526366.1 hypothetical protein F5B22DRAFT_154906 [Xylaria bambusicola]